MWLQTDKYKTAGAAWKQINEKRRLLWLNLKGLEESRGDFFFRTQRIANRLHHSIDFGNQHGVKHKILKQMLNDTMMRYKPENVCTWQICCDCQHCIETSAAAAGRLQREPELLKKGDFSVFLLSKLNWEEIEKEIIQNLLSRFCYSNVDVPVNTFGFLNFFRNGHPEKQNTVKIWLRGHPWTS